MMPGNIGLLFIFTRLVVSVVTYLHDTQYTLICYNLHGDKL